MPVVQKCNSLKQYCEFIEIVARHKAISKENPTEEVMDNWYDKAINEAISNNILTDYLTRNATEVKNMLQAEYDYDLDMQVKAEEAKEEKAVEAALVLIKDFHAEPEVAAQKMNAPLDKVLESLSSTTVHA